MWHIISKTLKSKPWLEGRCTRVFALYISTQAAQRIREILFRSPVDKRGHTTSSACMRANTKFMSARATNRTYQFTLISWFKADQQRKGHTHTHAR